MHIYFKIQKKYNYTDYQMKLILYAVKSFLSEFSKFFILSIYFTLTSHTYYFFWVFFILAFMRFFSGGLHCKTYVGCLLSSFIYTCFCIQILPHIPINKPVQLILLLVVIIILFKITPVPSKYRPPYTEYKKYFCRLQITIAILGYWTLVLILPSYPYISMGFWVIIIHTLQLYISYLEVNKYAI